MLFQYIGSGADAPATTEVYDCFFVLNGEPVEVTNAHSIGKLMGNSSFKHEPVLAAPVPPVASAVTAPLEITAPDEGDDVPDVIQTKPTIATVHSKKHSRK